MNYQGPSEKEKILEEHLQTLAWHEANPRAAPGTPDSYQWGVHPNLKPPKDAVDYVIGRAKREVHKLSQNDKMDPEWRFAFIVVVTAHFLWLRSKAGAAWLMRFYGIEELTPFLEGYRYFLWTKGQRTEVGSAPDQCTEVGGAAAYKLRIFRPCARDVSTLMVGSQTSTRVAEMKSLLDKVRNPYAKMPFPHSEGGVFHLVSKYLQDWFFEPKPDFTFPYQKSDRITGFSWAKHLKRDDTHLVYPAIEEMEMHPGGCYRIEDPRGGVLWVGRAEMRVVPLIDIVRRSGSMSEYDIRNVFECSSCGHLRPCLPVSGQRKLCCMCYGSQIERDNRPTLDYCTRLECKNCPSYQSDPDKLNMLKSRLNREVEFPANRYR